MILCIDGGTTNTRLSVFDGTTLLHEEKLAVGARAAGEDRAAFFSALHEKLALLEKACHPEKILASGMITSERGLCEVPHVLAPAGKKELKAGSKTVLIPELSGLPFTLLPGVKKNAPFPETDTVRGEETELFGIFEQMNVSGAVAVLLPGSHGKLILTDEQTRITDVTTFLTGELLAATADHTVLSSSVDLAETDFNDRLFDGCAYALQEGILQALFKVRVLEKFCGGTKKDAYSFLLGAILSGEVAAVKAKNVHSVLIGGQTTLKNAEAALLQKFTDQTVTVVPDGIARRAPAIGMMAIDRMT